MYIMCVKQCMFSALSRRVGALQISIIIIINILINTVKTRNADKRLLEEKARPHFTQSPHQRAVCLTSNNVTEIQNSF